MQTHLEFSRGSQQGVRVVIDRPALVIFWEAKNHGKLGSWQRTFTSEAELQSFEDEMAAWLRHNNFMLESDTDA